MPTELSTEELKQIGIDLQAGRIFTSAQISNIEDIGFVFMALLFVDDEGRESLKDTAVVYEYLSEAGPVAINGMPTFMSLRSLTAEQWKQVLEFARKADEALKAL